MDKLRINFISQGGAQLASHKMRVQKPAELLNVGCGGAIEAVTVLSKL
jgi:hypothetical protein